MSEGRPVDDDAHRRASEVGFSSRSAALSALDAKMELRHTKATADGGLNPRSSRGQADIALIPRESSTFGDVSPLHQELLSPVIEDHETVTSDGPSDLIEEYAQRLLEQADALREESRAGTCHERISERIGVHLEALESMLAGTHAMMRRATRSCRTACDSLLRAEPPACEDLALQHVVSLLSRDLPLLCLVDGQILANHNLAKEDSTTEHGRKVLLGCNEALQNALPCSTNLLLCLLGESVRCHVERLKCQVSDTRKQLQAFGEALDLPKDKLIRSNMFRSAFFSVSSSLNGLASIDSPVVPAVRNIRRTTLALCRRDTSDGIDSAVAQLATVLDSDHHIPLCATRNLRSAKRLLEDVQCSTPECVKGLLMELTLLHSSLAPWREGCDIESDHDAIGAVVKKLQACKGTLRQLCAGLCDQIRSFPTQRAEKVLLGHFEIPRRYQFVLEAHRRMQDSALLLQSLRVNVEAPNVRCVLSKLAYDSSALHREATQGGLTDRRVANDLGEHADAVESLQHSARDTTLAEVVDALEDTRDSLGELLALSGLPPHLQEGIAQHYASMTDDTNRLRLLAQRARAATLKGVELPEGVTAEVTTYLRCLDYAMTQDSMTQMIPLAKQVAECEREVGKALSLPECKGAVKPLLEEHRSTLRALRDLDETVQDVTFVYRQETQPLMESTVLSLSARSATTSMRGRSDSPVGMIKKVSFESYSPPRFEPAPHDDVADTALIEPRIEEADSAPASAPSPVPTTSPPPAVPSPTPVPAVQEVVLSDFGNSQKSSKGDVHSALCSYDDDDDASEGMNMTIPLTSRPRFVTLPHGVTWQFYQGLTELQKQRLQKAVAADISVALTKPCGVSVRDVFPGSVIFSLHIDDDDAGAECDDLITSGRLALPLTDHLLREFGWNGGEGDGEGNSDGDSESSSLARAQMDLEEAQRENAMSITELASLELESARRMAATQEQQQQQHTAPPAHPTPPPVQIPHVQTPATPTDQVAPVRLFAQTTSLVTPQEAVRAEASAGVADRSVPASSVDTEEVLVKADTTLLSVASATCSASSSSSSLWGTPPPAVSPEGYDDNELVRNDSLTQLQRLADASSSDAKASPASAPFFCMVSPPGGDDAGDLSEQIGELKKLIKNIHTEKPVQRQPDTPELVQVAPEPDSEVIEVVAMLAEQQMRVADLLDKNKDLPGALKSQLHHHQVELQKILTTPSFAPASSDAIPQDVQHMIGAYRSIAGHVAHCSEGETPLTEEQLKEQLARQLECLGGMLTLPGLPAGVYRELGKQIQEIAEFEPGDDMHERVVRLTREHDDRLASLEQGDMMRTLKLRPSELNQLSSIRRLAEEELNTPFALPSTSPVNSSLTPRQAWEDLRTRGLTKTRSTPLLLQSQTPSLQNLSVQYAPPHTDEMSGGLMKSVTSVSTGHETSEPAPEVAMKLLELEQQQSQIMDMLSSRTRQREDLAPRKDDSVSEGEQADMLYLTQERDEAIIELEMLKRLSESVTQREAGAVPESEPLWATKLRSDIQVMQSLPSSSSLDEPEWAKKLREDLTQHMSSLEGVLETTTLASTVAMSVKDDGSFFELTPLEETLPPSRVDRSDPAVRMVQKIMSKLDSLPREIQQQLIADIKQPGPQTKEEASAALREVVSKIQHPAQHTQSTVEAPESEEDNSDLDEAKSEMRRELEELTRLSEVSSVAPTPAGARRAARSGHTPHWVADILKAVRDISQPQVARMGYELEALESAVHTQQQVIAQMQAQMKPSQLEEPSVQHRAAAPQPMPATDSAVDDAETEAVQAEEPQASVEPLASGVVPEPNVEQHDKTPELLAQESTGEQPSSLANTSVHLVPDVLPTASHPQHALTQLKEEIVRDLRASVSPPSRFYDHDTNTPRRDASTDSAIAELRREQDALAHMYSSRHGPQQPVHDYDAQLDIILRAQQPLLDVLQKQNSSPQRQEVNQSPTAEPQASPPARQDADTATEVPSWASQLLTTINDKINRLESTAITPAQLDSRLSNLASQVLQPTHSDPMLHLQSSFTSSQARYAIAESQEELRNLNTMSQLQPHSDMESLFQSQQAVLEQLQQQQEDKQSSSPSDEKNAELLSALKAQQEMIAKMQQSQSVPATIEVSEDQVTAQVDLGGSESDVLQIPVEGVHAPSELEALFQSQQAMLEELQQKQADEAAPSAAPDKNAELLSALKTQQEMIAKMQQSQSVAQPESIIAPEVVVVPKEQTAAEVELNRAESGGDLAAQFKAQQALLEELAGRQAQETGQSKDLAAAVDVQRSLIAEMKDVSGTTLQEGSTSVAQERVAEAESGGDVGEVFTAQQALLEELASPVAADETENSALAAAVRAQQDMIAKLRESTTHVADPSVEPVDSKDTPSELEALFQSQQAMLEQLQQKQQEEDKQASSPSDDKNAGLLSALKAQQEMIAKMQQSQSVVSPASTEPAVVPEKQTAAEVDLNRAESGGDLAAQFKAQQALLEELAGRQAQETGQSKDLAAAVDVQRSLIAEMKDVSGTTLQEGSTSVAQERVAEAESGGDVGEVFTAQQALLEELASPVAADETENSALAAAVRAQQDMIAKLRESTTHVADPSVEPVESKDTPSELEALFQSQQAMLEQLQQKQQQKEKQPSSSSDDKSAELLSALKAQQEMIAKMQQSQSVSQRETTADIAAVPEDENESGNDLELRVAEVSSPIEPVPPSQAPDTLQISSVPLPEQHTARHVEEEDSASDVLQVSGVVAGVEGTASEQGTSALQSLFQSQQAMLEQLHENRRDKEVASSQHDESKNAELLSALKAQQEMIAKLQQSQSVVSPESTEPAVVPEKQTAAEVELNRAESGGDLAAQFKAQQALLEELAGRQAQETGQSKDLAAAVDVQRSLIEEMKDVSGTTLQEGSTSVEQERVAEAESGGDVGEVFTAQQALLEELASPVAAAETENSALAAAVRAQQDMIAKLRESTTHVADPSVETVESKDAPSELEALFQSQQAMLEQLQQKQQEEDKQASSPSDDKNAELLSALKAPQEMIAKMQQSQSVVSPASTEPVVVPKEQTAAEVELNRAESGGDLAAQFKAQQALLEELAGRQAQETGQSKYLAAAVDVQRSLIAEMKDVSGTTLQEGSISVAQERVAEAESGGDVGEVFTAQQALLEELASPVAADETENSALAAAVRAQQDMIAKLRESTTHVADPSVEPVESKDAPSELEALFQSQQAMLEQLQQKQQQLGKRAPSSSDESITSSFTSSQARYAIAESQEELRNLNTMSQLQPHSDMESLFQSQQAMLEQLQKQQEDKQASSPSDDKNAELLSALKAQQEMIAKMQQSQSAPVPVEVSEDQVTTQVDLGGSESDVLQVRGVEGVHAPSELETLFQSQQAMLEELQQQKENKEGTFAGQDKNADLLSALKAQQQMIAKMQQSQSASQRETTAVIAAVPEEENASGKDLEMRTAEVSRSIEPVPLTTQLLPPQDTQSPVKESKNAELLSALKAQQKAIMLMHSESAAPVTVPQRQAAPQLSQADNLQPSGMDTGVDTTESDQATFELEALFQSQQAMLEELQQKQADEAAPSAAPDKNAELLSALKTQQEMIAKMQQSQSVAEPESIIAPEVVVVPKEQTAAEVDLNRAESGGDLAAQFKAQQALLEELAGRQAQETGQSKDLAAAVDVQRSLIAEMKDVSGTTLQEGSTSVAQERVAEAESGGDVGEVFTAQQALLEELASPVAADETENSALAAAVRAQQDMIATLRERRAVTQSAVEPTAHNVATSELEAVFQSQQAMLEQLQQNQQQEDKQASSSSDDKNAELLSALKAQQEMIAKLQTQSQSVASIEQTVPHVELAASGSVSGVVAGVEDTAPEEATSELEALFQSQQAMLEQLQQKQTDEAAPSAAPDKNAELLSALKAQQEMIAKLQQSQSVVSPESTEPAVVPEKQTAAEVELNRAESGGDLAAQFKAQQALLEELAGRQAQETGQSKYLAAAVDVQRSLIAEMKDVSGTTLQEGSTSVAQERVAEAESGGDVGEVFTAQQALLEELASPVAAAETENSALAAAVRAQQDMIAKLRESTTHVADPSVEPVESKDAPSELEALFQSQQAMLEQLQNQQEEEKQASSSSDDKNAELLSALKAQQEMIAKLQTQSQSVASIEQTVPHVELAASGSVSGVVAGVEDTAPEEATSELEALFQSQQAMLEQLQQKQTDEAAPSAAPDKNAELLSALKAQQEMIAKLQQSQSVVSPESTEPAVVPEKQTAAEVELNRAESGGDLAAQFKAQQALLEELAGRQAQETGQSKYLAAAVDVQRSLIAEMKDVSGTTLQEGSTSVAQERVAEAESGGDVGEVFTAQQALLEELASPVAAAETENSALAAAVRAQQDMIAKLRESTTHVADPSVEPVESKDAPSELEALFQSQQAMLEQLQNQQEEEKQASSSSDDKNAELLSALKAQQEMIAKMQQSQSVVSPASTEPAVVPDPKVQTAAEVDLNRAESGGDLAAQFKAQQALLEELAGRQAQETGQSKDLAAAVDVQRSLIAEMKDVSGTTLQEGSTSVAQERVAEAESGGDVGEVFTAQQALLEELASPVAAAETENSALAAAVRAQQDMIAKLRESTTHVADPSVEPVESKDAPSELEALFQSQQAMLEQLQNQQQQEDKQPSSSSDDKNAELLSALKAQQEMIAKMQQSQSVTARTSTSVSDDATPVGVECVATDVPEVSTDEVLVKDHCAADESALRLKQMVEQLSLIETCERRGCELGPLSESARCLLLDDVIELQDSFMCFRDAGNEGDSSFERDLLAAGQRLGFYKSPTQERTETVPESVESLEYRLAHSLDSVLAKVSQTMKEDGDAEAKEDVSEIAPQELTMPCIANEAVLDPEESDVRDEDDHVPRNVPMAVSSPSSPQSTYSATATTVLESFAVQQSLVNELQETLVESAASAPSARRQRLVHALKEQLHLLETLQVQDPAVEQMAEQSHHPEEHVDDLLDICQILTAQQDAIDKLQTAQSFPMAEDRSHPDMSVVPENVLEVLRSQQDVIHSLQAQVSQLVSSPPRHSDMESLFQSQQAMLEQLQQQQEDKQETSSEHDKNAELLSALKTQQEMIAKMQQSQSVVSPESTEPVVVPKEQTAAEVELNRAESGGDLAAQFKAQQALLEELAGRQAQETGQSKDLAAAVDVQRSLIAEMKDVSGTTLQEGSTSVAQERVAEAESGGDVGEVFTAQQALLEELASPVAADETENSALAAAVRAQQDMIAKLRESTTHVADPSVEPVDSKDAPSELEALFQSQQAMLEQLQNQQEEEKQASSPSDDKNAELLSALKTQQEMIAKMQQSQSVVSPESTEPAVVPEKQTAAEVELNRAESGGDLAAQFKAQQALLEELAGRQAQETGQSKDLAAAVDVQRSLIEEMKDVSGTTLQEGSISVAQERVAEAESGGDVGEVFTAQQALLEELASPVAADETENSALAAAVRAQQDMIAKLRESTTHVADPSVEPVESKDAPSELEALFQSQQAMLEQLQQNQQQEDKQASSSSDDKNAELLSALKAQQEMIAKLQQSQSVVSPESTEPVVVPEEQTAAEVDCVSTEPSSTVNKLVVVEGDLVASSHTLVGEISTAQQSENQRSEDSALDECEYNTALPRECATQSAVPVESAPVVAPEESVATGDVDRHVSGEAKLDHAAEKLGEPAALYSSTAASMQVAARTDAPAKPLATDLLTEADLIQCLKRPGEGPAVFSEAVAIPERMSLQRTTDFLASMKEKYMAKSPVYDDGEFVVHVTEEEVQAVQQDVAHTRVAAGDFAQKKFEQTWSPGTHPIVDRIAELRDSVLMNRNKLSSLSLRIATCDCNE